MHMAAKQYNEFWKIDLQILKLCVDMIEIARESVQDFADTVMSKNRLINACQYSFENSCVKVLAFNTNVDKQECTN